MDAEQIAALLPIAVVGSIRCAADMVEGRFPDLRGKEKEDLVCAVIKRSRHFLSQPTDMAA